MMKKLLIALLCLAFCMAAFTACGGDTDPVIDGTGASDIPAETAAETTSTPQEKEPPYAIDFGTLENVGNDVNNLFQDDRAPVFSENCIYYPIKDTALFRVQYDGSDNQKIADGDFRYLNLYGNTIFAADEDNRIYAIDIENGSKAIFYEHSTDIEFMIMVDEFLVFHDKNRDTLFLNVTDSTVTVFKNEFISPDTARFYSFLTTDGKNIYSLLKTDDKDAIFSVFMICLEDVRNNAQAEATMLNGVSLGNLSGKILGSNGIAFHGRTSSDMVYLKYKLFEDIDLSEGLWYTHDTLAKQEQKDIVSIGGFYYILGEKLVNMSGFYNTEKQRLQCSYRYYDGGLDRANQVDFPEVFGAHSQNFNTLSFGMYNEKLYTILIDVEDASLNKMVVIDSKDWTMKEYPLA